MIWLYIFIYKYFECNSFPARCYGIIDCAKNEDLFKSIAALRDDKPDIFLDREELYIKIN